MRKLALGIPGWRWHGAPTVPAETREWSFAGIGPVQTDRLGRVGEARPGGQQPLLSAPHSSAHSAARDAVERALTCARSSARALES